MDLFNKITEYLKKSIKLLIFTIVFCGVLFVYNQNLQTINYILKRGVILEYLIPYDSKIDIAEIKAKLLNLKIKYSYIDIIDNSKFKVYDVEQKPVKKELLIGLAILAKNNKEPLFNDISDFVFDKYQNSELIDIKSLNNNYHEPYSGFLKFLTVTFVSLLIWIILLYLIYGVKSVNQNISDGIKKFIEKRRESFKNLIQKTREKGFKYLIARILFDGDKEEETDFTREIISTIIFVLVAVILIRYFIGELRWIPSGSMRPTILERDRVYVEKITDKKEIKRGDILVFYPPSTELSNSPIAIFARLSGIFCKDIAYIKRAIGLPNDKFEIKRDEISKEYRVYINDKPLNEPYISSKTEWTPCAEDMYCGPFVIPEGHYFMMGDNRNNSQDSRFWGLLDRNRIIGRANFMFWPVARINILTDKYLNVHKKKTKDGFETFKYILNRYEFL